MTIFTQTTGERIKIARLRLGLTQQELADKLNDELDGAEIVERSLISRWEQDKNFPRNSRRKAVEKLLQIDLGSTPVRRETFSSYMTNRDEMEKVVLIGLQNCNEIWMTNKTLERSIWHELSEVSKLLKKLRADPRCYFREIYYIQTTEDLVRIKALAEHNFPNYEMRIRVSPGHAFPVMLAPKNRFGVLLSGFFDDITSVGLELSGQVAGFNEHYLRLIWNKATPILENGTFQKQNYRHALHTLKQLGGRVRNEFKEIF